MCFHPAMIIADARRALAAGNVKEAQRQMRQAKNEEEMYFRKYGEHTSDGPTALRKLEQEIAAHTVVEQRSSLD